MITLETRLNHLTALRDDFYGDVPENTESLSVGQLYTQLGRNLQLIKLEMTISNLTQLTNVGQVTSLKILRLTGHFQRISLQFLCNLNLEELYLAKFQIDSVQLIENQKLQKLYIFRSNIEDYGFLTKLKLKSVGLTIRRLSEMPNIQIQQLQLQIGSRTDLSFLEQFKQRLTKLSIQKLCNTAEQFDLTFLGQFDLLQSLSLKNFRQFDCKILNKMKNLSNLCLDCDSVSNLEALKDLPIQSLYIKRLQNVNVVQGELKAISAQHLQISSQEIMNLTQQNIQISFLHKKYLESISNGQKIVVPKQLSQQHIDQLLKDSCATSVDLSFSQIQNLSFIPFSIEELDLSGVKSPLKIGCVAQLENLKYLNIYKANIADSEQLTQFCHLKKLNCSLKSLQILFQIVDRNDEIEIYLGKHRFFFKQCVDLANCNFTDIQNAVLPDTVSKIVVPNVDGFLFLLRQNPYLNVKCGNRQICLYKQFTLRQNQFDFSQLDFGVEKVKIVSSTQNIKGFFDFVQKNPSCKKQFNYNDYEKGVLTLTLFSQKHVDAIKEHLGSQYLSPFKLIILIKNLVFDCVLAKDLRQVELSGPVANAHMLTNAKDLGLLGQRDFDCSALQQIKLNSLKIQGSFVNLQCITDLSHLNLQTGQNAIFDCVLIQKLALQSLQLQCDIKNLSLLNTSQLKSIEFHTTKEPISLLFSTNISLSCHLTPNQFFVSVQKLYPSFCRLFKLSNNKKVDYTKKQKQTFFVDKKIESDYDFTDVTRRYKLLKRKFSEVKEGLNMVQKERSFIMRIIKDFDVSNFQVKGLQ